MLEAQLRQLGLSDKEAAVYLATLTLGSAPVQAIARQAKVNRPTTYFILEKLVKEKGLVTHLDRGKKRYFAAAAPERLKVLLEERQRALVDSQKALDDLLPKLQAIQHAGGDQPKVRFFEGLEGLKAMHQEFLRTEDKEIRSFVPVDELFAVFQDRNIGYTEQRIKQGIRSKVIYTSTLGNQLSTDPAKLRETKTLPPNKLDLTADITIFEGKLAVASLEGDLSGVIIENEQIAKTFRSIFDALWRRI